MLVHTKQSLNQTGGTNPRGDHGSVNDPRSLNLLPVLVRLSNKALTFVIFLVTLVVMWTSQLLLRILWSGMRNLESSVPLLLMRVRLSRKIAFLVSLLLLGMFVTPW